MDTNDPHIEAPVLYSRGSAHIDAPLAKVWAIVGDYSDLTWVPAVKTSSSTLGNRVGSVRTLDFGGSTLTEVLVNYDDVEHGYTYRVITNAQNAQTVPMAELEATIWIISDGRGWTIATWSGRFRRSDQGPEPAAGKDDVAAQEQMCGTIKSGLAGLKAKAERS